MWSFVIGVLVVVISVTFVPFLTVEYTRRVTRSDRETKRRQKLVGVLVADASEVIAMAGVSPDEEDVLDQRWQLLVLRFATLSNDRDTDWLAVLFSARRTWSEQDMPEIARLLGVWANATRLWDGPLRTWATITKRPIRQRVKLPDSQKAADKQ